MKKILFPVLFAVCIFSVGLDAFAKKGDVSAQCTSCSIPFGKVTLGQSSSSGSDMHFYGGSAYVASAVLSGSPDFQLTYDGCSGASLFYSACTFTITFTPSTTGPKTATISYLMDGTYDDEDSTHYHEVVTFALTGTGYQKVAKVPAKDVCASIINPESRVLRENIPVTGCGFDMYYTTESADGFGPSTPFTNRISYFNPEGWSASIHHFYDIAQGKLQRGTGVGEILPASIDGVNYRVVSSDGSEVYIFDANGRHLFTKTGLTGATKFSFSYESHNKLSSIDDAYGNSTVFNRDSSGILTSIQSPYGVTTYIGTNASGLISSVQNPKSETYYLTYKTGTELLATFQKPGGQTSTFTYDSSGKLTKDQSYGGNFWSLVETSGATWPIQMSSAIGVTTNYKSTVNTDGSVDRAVSSSLYSMTYSETSSGNTSENAEGVQKDITYGADERFGTANKRLTVSALKYSTTTMSTTYSQSVVWPSGVTADWFNYSTITTGATVGAQTTSTVFDNSTKTVTTTTPEGSTATITFDANERMIGTRLGSDTPWTYTYDTRGRLFQVYQGSNNGLTYTYNSSGFLKSITNARGETTTYSYDLAGRVSQVTLPDTRVVTYSYDSNGNVTSITPPSKPLHGFSFNAMELISTYSPPTLIGIVNKDTTYSYNLDKQLTQVTRPDGATITYSYDATSGLLTTKAIAAGNFTYSYLSKNRLSLAYSPDDYYNSLSWYGTKLLGDAQWKTSTGFIFGKASYTYDSQHRISSRTFRGNSASNTFTRNITYNNDSQPIQVGDLSLSYSYPSGRLITTILDKISDSRTYDSYGNLSSYTAIYNPTVGAPQSLYSYTLTRDSMGRISAKSETVLGVTDVYAYAYDASDRLIEVLKNGLAYSSYTYDSNGNRTSGTTAGTAFSATYDDQDRILTYNSRTYSYNANGDLAQIQWTPTTQSLYTYDALGNLRQSTLSTGNVLTYGYDGLNRRVHKFDGSTLKVHYIYEDQYKIAGHVNGSGVIQKEYVYATSAYTPDYMVASSVNYRLIKDHLGSPRLIVKTDDGTVAQRLDYTDLGEAITDTNSGFQSFGFAGGIYDGQTKLLKFGQREYDPRAAGRWTTKDPIRFGGGDTNLYGYVANDPVNWADSSGLTINDRTNGNIPDIVKNSAIYRYLDSLPNVVDISTGVIPGDPTGRGTTNSSFNGCMNEIIINPETQLSSNDLADSYFHELSHAAKNIQFGARTSLGADHLIFGPIDAGADMFNGRSYAP